MTLNRPRRIALALLVAASAVGARNVSAASAATAAAAPAAGERKGPDAAVRRFYDSYLEHKPPGLPAGSDLERLRPLLSSGLAKKIDAALAHQREFIAKHPDEKPPFVDGDHFSSVFEGPTAFEIGATEALGTNVWKVVVRFPGEADASSASAWQDAVVVVDEKGRFLIDDVIYGGAGEFNPPGKLSDRLEAREE
jgi:uncharacterized Ntn-hydrolase superfamily protein